MKIFDKYYHIFGYQIHIRILPMEFREDLYHITDVLDSGDLPETECQLKKAFIKWGSDPELLRLEEIFLMEFEEDGGDLG